MDRQVLQGLWKERVLFRPDKMKDMEIIRATKTAEQAGAYYVRIQAMARKHQIPLDVEFDKHDTPDTKYIVAVDNYLPIATCCK